MNDSGDVDGQGLACCWSRWALSDLSGLAMALLVLAEKLKPGNDALKVMRNLLD